MSNVEAFMQDFAAVAKNPKGQLEKYKAEGKKDAEADKKAEGDLPAEKQPKQDGK